MFKVGDADGVHLDHGLVRCGHLQCLHLLVQLILFNGYKATYAGDADYLPSSGQAGIIK